MGWPRRGEGRRVVQAARDLGRGLLRLAEQVNGELEVSEMRGVQQLEEENPGLKSIVADQALDIRALKDLPAKKNDYGPR